jgi:hypothetical protein
MRACGAQEHMHTHRIFFRRQGSHARWVLVRFDLFSSRGVGAALVPALGGSSSSSCSAALADRLRLSCSS